MPVSLSSLGLDRLPRDERLALVEALWDSIVSEGLPPLSPARRQELERRLDEDDASPDDIVPWEEVKAKARAEFGS